MWWLRNCYVYLLDVFVWKRRSYFAWKKLYRNTRTAARILHVPGIRRSLVQTGFGISERLSVQSADGEIWDAVLSSECGRQRQHLSGHSQGEVVSVVRRSDHPAVCTKPPGRWLSDCVRLKLSKHCTVSDCCSVYKHYCCYSNTVLYLAPFNSGRDCICWEFMWHFAC